MMGIYIIIFLGLLLSNLSFKGCTNIDPDSDLDEFFELINSSQIEKQVNDNIEEKTTTIENVPFKPKAKVSYRSMDDDGPNLTEIFRHIDEMEDLGCGFGNPHDMNAFRGKQFELESHFAEFPWTVAIKTNDGLFLGGGTLVAPDIVISLASLFQNIVTKDNIQVVAGEWEKDSEVEIMPHLSRSVASIIEHPDFVGYTNDVALLILRLGFSSQPNIRTICLPTPATLIDHSGCLSTAWSFPDINKLKKYQFKIQSQDVCEQRLPRPYNTVDPSVLCATHMVDSTSSLNSGAALFCPMKGNSNRYTQMGIFIGITNRNDIKTGLFVNVTQFMPWIFKQLGPRNTNLKYYLP